jgi:zinc protease
MKLHPFFLNYLLFLICSQTALAIPTIEQWQTNNGAEVYFIATPELPMVNIEMTFNAGSARDGNYPGLAKLTAKMLDEGADGQSADHIAEHFDNLGAQFASSVDNDHATLSLQTLTDEDVLPMALEMFAKLLAKPDFEITAFERVRQQTILSLQDEEQQPSAIAEKAFYQATFADHPYAIPSSGTTDSITALTPEQLKAFHAQYYVAKNAILAIVGALNRTQAQQVAEKITNLLPIGNPAPNLPKVATLSASKTIHIPFPSTQTHILTGQPGMARNDPDYFVLYVGNYILGGGGLTSRLGVEIREKRGLVYNVYSYFNPLQVNGPFLAGLETRNEQAEPAKQLVQNLLHDFIAKGPSDAELAEAKQSIIRRFPLRIKSNSQLVSQLSTIGSYHLPLDYLNTFNQKIEAITLEQIKETFLRRLQLDKWVTITVGGGKNSK